MLASKKKNRSAQRRATIAALQQTLVCQPAQFSRRGGDRLRPSFSELVSKIMRIQDGNGKVREMTSEKTMPPQIAAIQDCGFAIWSGDEVAEEFRSKFDPHRIPVKGIRQVRVWGLQVDDERELPGLERTSIPDEEIWEINLEAKDGSLYEVESRLLVAAEP